MISAVHQARLVFCFKFTHNYNYNLSTKSKSNISQMNHLIPASLDNNFASESMERQGTPARQIFFRRLHAMITNEARTGCITWLPDGLGFVISSKQKFADVILPLYFGRTKFASFARRLKRWGFTRRQKDGSFHHDQFRRDGMVFDVDDDTSSLGFEIKTNCGPPTTSGLKMKVTPTSKGPLKKRFKQRWMIEQSVEQRLPSPVPVCLSPGSDSGVSFSKHLPNDMRLMPELMRAINRNKRRERNELLLLAATRKSKKEILVAHALASLELQGRPKPSPYFGCVECSPQCIPIMKPKIFSFSRAA